jgi:hypothetical protein
MRLLGPVAALSAITLHFPTNAGLLTVHCSRDVAVVMSGFGKDGNLVPFVLGEVFVFHSAQL